MDTGNTAEPISTWETQAQDLARQSKWRAAARTLLRAARAEPDKTERWLQIAQWQRRDRDSKGAARTLRTALRLHSSQEKQKSVPALSTLADQSASATLWQALAETQLEAQSWQECVNACRELLALQPRNHFALEMLATALLYDGQPKDAALVMRQLLALSPRDPLHRLKLATLLHLQGSLGESLVEFQRVVTAYPDAPFTQEAQEAIEALDRIQIQHILARYSEQADFSHSLQGELDNALLEEGYHLSDSGLESLRHLLADGRPTDQRIAPRIH